MFWWKPKQQLNYLNNPWIASYDHFCSKNKSAEWSAKRVYVPDIFTFPISPNCQKISGTLRDLHPLRA